MSSRMFVFASALEPHVAPEAVRSSPVPLDPRSPAHPSGEQDGRVRVDGRPAQLVSEPLLAAHETSKSEVAEGARQAEACLARYALHTHAALVVWDELGDNLPEALVVDEYWLLDRAERISFALPPPGSASRNMLGPSNDGRTRRTVAALAS